MSADREAAIREALDDPLRHDWGGPWEHLGDAERDLRFLLAELAAAREAYPAIANGDVVPKDVFDAKVAEWIALYDDVKAELAAARERLDMLSHRAEWVHPDDHLRVVNRAQKAEAELAAARENFKRNLRLGTEDIRRERDEAREQIEKLREALREARKSFRTLRNMRPDNSLWPEVARVGLEDVDAALADGEGKT